MIKDLYRKYFQKSYTFLYPILRFNKFKHPKPAQTYITGGDITISDRKLICVYNIEDTDKWRNFEASNLMNHTMLENSVKIGESQIAYIFDFNLPDICDDFDTFLQGNYSKLSSDSKKAITTFYGIHTPEWVYIESYIHPHKYFKHYAKALLMEEEDLEKQGELCDKYDMNKENCELLINQLNL